MRKEKNKKKERKKERTREWKRDIKKEGSGERLWKEEIVRMTKKREREIILFMGRDFLY